MANSIVRNVYGHIGGCHMELQLFANKSGVRNYIIVYVSDNDI